MCPAYRAGNSQPIPALTRAHESETDETISVEIGRNGSDSPLFWVSFQAYWVFKYLPGTLKITHKDVLLRTLDDHDQKIWRRGRLKVLTDDLCEWLRPRNSGERSSQSTFVVGNSGERSTKGTLCRPYSCTDQLLYDPITPQFY